MTAADIARKVAKPRRGRRGDDRQRGAGVRLHPAEQRDRLGVPLEARAADRLRGARHRPQAPLPQGRVAAGDAGHQPQVGRRHADQLPAPGHRRPAGRPGDRAGTRHLPQPALRGDRDRQPARLDDRDQALRRVVCDQGRHARRRRPARDEPAGGRRPREGHRRARRRRLPRGRGRRQGKPRDQGRLEGEDRRDRHELRGHLRRLVVHAPLPGDARLPDDLLHRRAARRAASST